MKKTLISCLFTLFSPAILAQTIVVSALTQAPQMNGEGSDWENLPVYKIKLTPTRPSSALKSREVFLSAGHFQDQVFFYAQWPDD